MDKDKDTIFFSNYCQYSTELITKIKSNNLSNMFNYVCVDDRSIRLPQFINRVPILVIKGGTGIKVDDALFAYIDEIVTKSTELQEFVPTLRNSYTSTYAACDEEGGTNRNQTLDSYFMNKPFSYDDIDKPIQSPADFLVSTADDEKKDTKVSMDLLIAQRDNDVKSILHSQQRV